MITAKDIGIFFLQFIMILFGRRLADCRFCGEMYWARGVDSHRCAEQKSGGGNA